VITLLVNHVRRLIRAKFFMAKGVTGRKLGEPLEMNPYIAQKLGETAKKYPDKILEEVFVELAEADFKLKTGRAGVEALERIIIKLCNR
ncbi:MAG: DNA polymerase III subunit delta, partial [Selenomonadaceae bacterium]|nr:DNA polymerase III subunit delta [Selenomonadaceae bacterium]